MNRFPASISRIHFVGIGGIGMSGIADVLINLGYKISGSDLKENAMTAKLSRKGIDIKIGHEPGNVHDASVVVMSSAISNDNPEILEARRLKIPVIKRAEMLAELMKMKKSIAVAGTHGKTTTTSLVGAILEQSGFDPTIINGGVINAYNSNARLGAGEWIVVEADESDGSFTKLMSTIAIVTNIDMDHLNNFKDFDELRDLFGKFVENTPFYGAAVLCIDHPEVEKLAQKIIDRRVITYGFKKSADVSCDGLTLSNNGAEFDVVFSQNMMERHRHLSKRCWERLNLNMYGEHNVQNALSVIAVCIELGILEEDVRLALGSFMGVKRRFTNVATINGVTIIDDYAHHPAEISAVLNAARTTCSGKIYIVMQPHRYTRLKMFLSEFADASALSDYVFVTPVYTAGELNQEGVDHFSLLKTIRERNIVRSDFVQDIDTLITKIMPLQKEGDMIIFMGAGDITKWAYDFAQRMQSVEE